MAPFNMLLSIVTVILLMVVAATAWHVIPRLMTARTLVRQTIPFTYESATSTMRILVVGDSTAVGVGADHPKTSIAGRLHHEWPEATIENYGRSGARTAQVIDQLPPTSTRYDLIVIQTGGNDIIYFTPLTQLQTHLHALLTHATARSNRVVMLTSGNVGLAPFFPRPWNHLWTWRTRQVRRVFMEGARATQVMYVDLYTDAATDPFAANPALYYAADGLHPSGEGYGLWYEQLQKSLEKMKIDI